MYIEELVDEISRRSDTHFQVDDDKRCSLKLENKYTLTIEESSDAQILYLYTVLGKIDNLFKNKVFAMLMEANLFGLETGGASFAFEPQGQVVILYQQFHTRKIDYPEFETLFWQFFNTTKTWTDKITDLSVTDHSLPNISSLQRQQWLKL